MSYGPPAKKSTQSMIFQDAIMCKHYNSVSSSSSSHGRTYHTGHVLSQFEVSKRNKRVYAYKVVVSTCGSTSSSGSSSTRIGVNMTTTTTTTKNETTTYTYIAPNNNLPPSHHASSTKTHEKTSNLSTSPPPKKKKSQRFNHV